MYAHPFLPSDASGASGKPEKALVIERTRKAILALAAASGLLLAITSLT